ncbi:ABC transporter permease [Streptomyces sp. NBC_01803]|uniref:ABC transporter permease n=1 Tax=Streptomyces sp. NBC_01803 TaxID=2975946 RepID=UPI002DD9C9A5|nr:ABC transporter permease [Streptomyces sp. NBC_01803]WSA45028.1 ABC transporter permease [Streptomyces sp. NBC_01803]
MSRTATARTGTGARWLLLPPTLLLAVGLAGPLVALIAAAWSTHGPAGVLTEPFESDLFIGATARTLWLSAVVTAVCWLVGTGYALALALAPAWLGRLLTAVLFLTFWVSLLVRTYGWVLTLQPGGALDELVQRLGLSADGESLGLYQTTPGLLPAMVHVMLPYMVLPIYAGLRAIDPAQLRAARSLGGGDLLVLRKVVLPALRSGSLAGAVLVFVLSLGFYVTPAFLGGPGDQVVSIVIGTEFGRLQNLGGAAAMGVVLLLAILAIYLIADRYLRIGEQWERL